MSIEGEMRDALDTFVLEASELLSNMEAGLLELESAGEDREILNSVFRAAHTIKGSAGLFGLAHVVGFTHVVEGVLDRLRGGELGVSPDLIGALLPCKDHIAELVDNIRAGKMSETPQQVQTGAQLVARLQPFLEGNPAAALGAGEGPPEPAAVAPGPEPARPIDAAERRMHLSLRFGPDCLRNGMDPISFIRYLSTVGTVVSLTTVADQLPGAENMDPEVCYLVFEVTLSTSADMEVVEGVFDFVREDSDIRVLPEGSPAAAYEGLLSSFGAIGPHIAEILARTGARPAPGARSGQSAPQVRRTLDREPLTAGVGGLQSVPAPTGPRLERPGPQPRTSPRRRHPQPSRRTATTARSRRSAGAATTAGAVRPRRSGWTPLGSTGSLTPSVSW